MGNWQKGHMKQHQGDMLILIAGNIKSRVLGNAQHISMHAYSEHKYVPIQWNILNRKGCKVSRGIHRFQLPLWI